MGGLGSGRRSSLNQTTINDQPCVDVNELHRGGYFQSRECYRRRWRWMSGTIVEVAMRFRDEAIECLYTRWLPGHDPEEIRTLILVSWTQCNFGGHRPWLHCGLDDCRHRVGKLYLVDPHLVCRRCAGGLPYKSQRQPLHVRRLARSGTIRERLGGEAGLGRPFPPRPKGKHHRTYERNRREVEDAEARYLDEVRASLLRLDSTVSALINRASRA